MKRFEHGGMVRDNILLDFSVNINPLGMPEEVKKAITEHINDYDTYPDSTCSALIGSIAAYEGTNTSYISCGNGAADIIFRLVSALKPEEILVPAPTFSEYEKAAVSQGCRVRYFPLLRENGYETDESILSAVNENTGIFFLCRPNNPTGHICSLSFVEKALKKCSETGTVLAVDECFMDLVKDSELLSAKCFLDRYSNLVIIKAFTKTFAMAGLRLGYMLTANEEIIRRTELSSQSWSVSSPAQYAGIAAAGCRSYLSEAVKLISEERRFLTDKLKGFGFEVFDSEANFILFSTSLPLEKLLRKEKISIRSCDNYTGLGEGFFRIAVRNHSENELLCSAVERVMNNG